MGEGWGREKKKKRKPLEILEGVLLHNVFATRGARWRLWEVPEGLSDTLSHVFLSNPQHKWGKYCHYSHVTDDEFELKAHIANLWQDWELILVLSATCVGYLWFYSINSNFIQVEESTRLMWSSKEKATWNRGNSKTVGMVDIILFSIWFYFFKKVI